MLVTTIIFFFVSLSYGCDPTKIEAFNVIQKGDADYEAGVHQYASKTVNVVVLQPSLIVFCATEQQVINAISYASSCNLTISTRSGGHSYAGCSSCGDGCMQIDVSAMDEIYVNSEKVTRCPKQEGCPETPLAQMEVKLVTAGSGVLLGQLDKIIGLYGLSVPHGGCETVRMGGHFQSSAWGHLATSHGSGLDRVVSFRLVLANATAITVSKDDANTTLYWSILGSAPGSWGVITEYTLDAIHNSEVPFTRFLVRTFAYSSDTFYKTIQHSQSILIAQEKRNTRDFKALLAIGPRTDSADLKTQYVVVYIMWTGIDSGELSEDLYNEYIKPYDDLGPEPFPSSLDLPLPLTLIVELASVNFLTTGYHYHVQSFHSDHWWEDDFLKLIVKEVDRRLVVPDTFISFQFLPLGFNTQWAKNAGQNALTWRKVRMYVDDWWMYKNATQAETIRKSMVNFRESTRKYWQMSDGSDRSTWMSPMTTIPGATDLRNPVVQKSYFPDDEVFKKLQALKREIDPEGLFGDQSTIPLN